MSEFVYTFRSDDPAIGGVTYGRLAVIVSNQQPAVDLLESTAPLSTGHLTANQPIQPSVAVDMTLPVGF